jgi:hypothetical protein
MNVKIEPAIVLQVIAGWVRAVRGVGRIAHTAVYFGLSYVGLALVMTLIRFSFQFITRSRQRGYTIGLPAPVGSKTIPSR